MPLIRQLEQLGIEDQHVLTALSRLPRHLFVAGAQAHHAYNNNALSIGFGQTISQPYIVAKMTQLLSLTPQSKVLEIGTGSGFQTCLLAELCAHVYSIERIKSLQIQAKRRFRLLEYFNISTKHADGAKGWENKGPFDAIIITAAAAQMPENLFSQLKIGASLVVPVGNTEQMLYKITNTGKKVTINAIEPVRFVPLITGDLA